MILVTGATGFIGYHLCRALLGAGHEVLGFASPATRPLQHARLQQLKLHKNSKNFRCLHGDLSEYVAIKNVFDEYPGVDTVVHLAGRSGVRLSMIEPQQYTSSNLDGFMNVIRAMTRARVKRFFYASSSSVYLVDSQGRRVSADHPTSYYAATKRCNELMAFAWGGCHGMMCTGMRLFPTYGPWGRPDMAPWVFTERLLRGEKIEIAGDGTQTRHFTYIDDLIAGIMLLLEQPDLPVLVDIAGYNVGSVMALLETCEKYTDRKSQVEYTQAGASDGNGAVADLTYLRRLGYEPTVPLDEGVFRFVKWYNEFHEMDDGMEYFMNDALDKAVRKDVEEYFHGRDSEHRLILKPRGIDGQKY